jgi:hypothetical protein
MQSGPPRVMPCKTFQKFGKHSNLNWPTVRQMDEYRAPSSAAFYAGYSTSAKVG